MALDNDQLQHLLFESFYDKKGVMDADRDVSQLYDYVVDTLGLPLTVVVHSAGIQDRDGAKAVFDAVMKKHSLMRLVYADGGYRGPRAETAAGLIDLEIVKRTMEGFSVIKKRWIVERSFAWLAGNRRRRVDYEGFAARALRR